MFFNPLDEAKVEAAKVEAVAVSFAKPVSFKAAAIAVAVAFVLGALVGHFG